jgi:hypothetical protein
MGCGGLTIFGETVGGRTQECLPRGNSWASAYIARVRVRGGFTLRRTILYRIFVRNPQRSSGSGKGQGSASKRGRAASDWAALRDAKCHLHYHPHPQTPSTSPMSTNAPVVSSAQLPSYVQVITPIPTPSDTPTQVVQGLLGLLVILSLVYKRHRESPKRPWKIWLFDVAKQLAGQMFVHGVNLLISGVVAKIESGNACVLYFLNILIDTTLGAQPLQLPSL